MVSGIIVLPCKNSLFCKFFIAPFFKGDLFAVLLRYDVVAILQDCMVKTPEFL